MRTIRWDPVDVPIYNEGTDGGLLEAHLNLTALYGEREYLRHGYPVDVDGDGRQEVVTRTMNANRCRAIDPADGSTVWTSPDIRPPPRESVQISDLTVGDLDGDGTREALLATYQGDVICVDTRDGSVRWHRRLGYLINNSNLAVRKITPGPGKDVALTVARGTRPSGPSPYWRNNHMFHPSLVVLDHAGETAFIVEEYAEHNAAGHYTWTADLDGDGYHEIACIGDGEVIWFDNDGTRLFSMPVEGDEDHPDDVLVCDLYPDRPGREIVYLDGTDAVRVHSTEGEPLQHRRYPESVASHLQLLECLDTPDGPRLIACNIRSVDSKLLLLDGDLEVEWGLELPPDLLPPMTADWDGDGHDEIIVGGAGKERYDPDAVEECSLAILDRDGSPLYWQRWTDASLCKPLAVADLDADGAEELLVSVGENDGPEGRFSLPEGTEQHLFVVEQP